MDKSDEEIILHRYRGKTDDEVIKPPTLNNVLYYYCPILGTASYTLLSIEMLYPMLSFRFLPRRDLTSFLLINSIIGTGCYIHSRPHLKLTLPSSRLGYSALGSVFFSFGSVLVWAILRSWLPENLIVGSAAGVATSYIFIKGASNYLKFVDSQVSK